MVKGFACHTHLRHPKKEISTQKSSYTYPKKQYFKRKHFSRSFERTITWPNRKRIFNLKNFIYLPKQTNFSNEKSSYTDLKEQIFYLKKKFLILTRKCFLYFQKKPNFPNENNFTLFICFRKLMLTKNISQFLLVKRFYFYVFYNFFLYSASPVFDLVGDFYIIGNHTVALRFSLLEKDLDTLHEFF